MNDDRAAKQAVLLRVPWLAQLPEPELKRLAQASRLVQLQDKEPIARRNRSLAHLIIVREGRLALTITGISGRRHVAGQLQAGQVFGLIPVIEKSTAIHDAESLGPSEVLLLPGDAFFEAIQHHHALAINLLLVLSERSRRMHDLLADRNLRSLGAQVAKLLLSMATMFGRQADRNTALDLRISQTDLADMLGVSRQSLHAELKKLQTQGFIAVSYSRVRILEPVRLEAMLSQDAR